MEKQGRKEGICSKGCALQYGCGPLCVACETSDGLRE